MFVLGIDPGLSRCGFGLVEAQPSGSHRWVRHGVLQTPHTDPIHLRLASLMEQLDGLLSDARPAAVVVERVFFQTNARTAMGVAQASGLALALATRRGCQVHQYTSNEVKQAVAGYGAAEKRQMQSMVAKLLGLDALPTPADAADALGLALCHLAVSRVERAALGAASLGRAISGQGTAAFGGRPLRLAASVGAVPIADSRPSPRGVPSGAAAEQGTVAR